MKYKLLLLLIIVSITSSLTAQKTLWQDDTLFYELWNNPKVVEEKSKYFENICRHIDNWKSVAVREYYSLDKQIIKTQYVSSNGCKLGYEYRYSKDGNLTNVLDNSTGEFVFGEEFKYYNFVKVARKKADSILHTMFKQSFISNHIPFCSDEIIIEYKGEYDYFSNSVHYFEEIPVKPFEVSFHYPISINDTIFLRQIYIDIDSSLKVVSVSPSQYEISNYELKMDYKTAKHIADSLGFTKRIVNMDCINHKDPELRYKDGDYHWLFQQVIEYKRDNNILCDGTGLIRMYYINSRTGEIKEEVVEFFIQT